VRASLIFTFDLVATGVVITVGVQLGRLYRRFRPAGGSDEGGGEAPWRYDPRGPAGSARMGVSPHCRGGGGRVRSSSRPKAQRKVWRSRP
jgi:hypothetical protein